VPATLLDASVIVATYNQFESTRLALQALFAQRTQYNYEVIVCDDGSDESTVAGLQEFLAAAPVPARLAWQQDRGFRAGASRNNGIRLARGRVLIMMDGDVVPAEDFVEVHAGAHTTQRRIAVGKRLWRNPTRITDDQKHDAEHLWALLRDEEPGDRLFNAKEAFELLYRHFFFKAAPWMACFTCNMSLTNRPGVEFDEDFVGWGNEDWDLSYRLSVVEGYEVELVDAIVYEVDGNMSKREVWNQRQFVEHLVNGFRLLDKWEHTGIPLEAFPRYDFDYETERWDFPKRRAGRSTPFNYEAYVQMARTWLERKGYYPPRHETARSAEPGIG
jgi:glycosyltransferase involved in cell wall biosynthesis